MLKRIVRGVQYSSLQSTNKTLSDGDVDQELFHQINQAKENGRAITTHFFLVNQAVPRGL